MTAMIQSDRLVGRFLARLRSNVYPLMILLVATVIRFYSLASNPPAVWSDELIPFASVLTLLHHGGPYFTQSLYSPTNLLTIALFGEPQSIALFGPTTLAIRFFGAAYGVGVVALTYAFGKRLFGSRVANWSAALVAVDPLAVQASRVFYMDESMVAVFWLLAGALLIYDYSIESRGGIWRLIVGGLAFGFAFDYFTSYSKITVLAVLAALLWQGASILVRKPLLRVRLAYIGIPLGILAALTLGFPQLDSLVGAGPQLGGAGVPLSAFFQSSTNLLLSGHYLTFDQQYFQYFSPQFLFITGDPNPSQNTGLTGELLYPSLVFFYLGLLIVFYRVFARPAKPSFSYVLVLLWLLTAPIESAAFVFNNYPDSGGVIFLIPMVEVVAAISIVSTLDFLSKRSWNWMPRGIAFWRHKRGPGSKSGVSRPEYRRRKDRAPLSKVVAIVIVITYGISGVVFVNAYFEVHPVETINNPATQWGMLYGYPQIASYIVNNHLTNLPLEESPNGLFDNNTSQTDYFFNDLSVPLAYLNYYSDGAIDQLNLTNVAYFYENHPSLILSGSYADYATLTKNGVLSKVVDAILRPNGTPALLLIETSPGLLPSQAAAINDTLASARNIPESSLTLSSELQLNHSFSLFTRFSVDTAPPESGGFQNVAQFENSSIPNAAWAGIRVSPQSIQPGGGPSNVWTINGYVVVNESGGSVALQLWSFVPISTNTTYSVALTFSQGNCALYINGEVVQFYSGVSPVALSLDDLSVGSTEIPVIGNVQAWQSGLTPAQVGFLYYGG